MIKIFLVLIVGFLIGYGGVLSQRQISWNGRLQTVWLLLLIFSMGVSIGKNGEVMQNLSVLGFRALVFAVFAIIGSVACVFVISRYFLEKGEK